MKDRLMVFGFYVILAVFQSYQDDGKVITKGCVQWNPVYGRKGFRLQRVHRTINALSHIYHDISVDTAHYRISHARDFGIWGSCNEF